MNDRKTLERYVDRGIALLDEKGPEDWRERIDLESLHIYLECNCILGQIYGNSYNEKVNIDLGILCCSSDGEESGFYLNDPGDWGYNEETEIREFYGYDELLKIWKEKLSTTG